MRLKDFEINAIKEAVLSIDKNAKVYLFGSRVDDSKKGGDIDLIVSSEIISKEDVIKIKLKIFEQLDEQKIDILISDKDIKPKYHKDKIFFDLISQQRKEL
ncbi:MAG TPA: nucleotidyltransferase domain-containing protein [Ignavibacteria bacterium]|nr:nucleotidyltransferase domain-containing protein [Ignavibacteria bacterium]